MCCRDMIPQTDAHRLGLIGTGACDPENPSCGAPNNSSYALNEWSECSDDASLDFWMEQRIAKLQPCIVNLTARESASKYGRKEAVAAKLLDVGGYLSNNFSKVRNWRKHYGVSSSYPILLHQESHDPLQERLWLRLREPEAFTILDQLGSYVLVTPGYSVYDDGSMCEVRQTLNIRRSLRDAARANQAGVPAIPTIGWNRHRNADLQFLGEWCKRQGNLLNMIAVNAQTGSLGKETAALIAGMTQLEETAGRTYSWVVFGGRRRIEQISEFIPRHRLVQIARQKDFQVPIRTKSGNLQVQMSLLN